MDDQELKKLLLETCPVRPGQEARAWGNLREQLYGAGARQNVWHWIYVPTWRGLAVTVAVTVAVAAIVFIPVFELAMHLSPATGLATADSQAPGIYATAFYSKPAQAQVVWLNGMEPATDQPTYLDPTTPVPRKGDQPARDPNSL